MFTTDITIIIRLYHLLFQECGKNTHHTFAMALKWILRHQQPSKNAKIYVSETVLAWNGGVVAITFAVNVKIPLIGTIIKALKTLRTHHMF